MNIEQTLMERAKYWYPRVWQREMWQNIWLRVQQNICYESFCEQNICKSDSLCLSLLISGLTSCWQTSGMFYLDQVNYFWLQDGFADLVSYDIFQEVSFHNHNILASRILLLLLLLITAVTNWLKSTKRYPATTKKPRYFHLKCIFCPGLCSR